MKVLRIDLQTGDRSIFDNEEKLRKHLIDLHWEDYEESYSDYWGYTDKQRKQKMKKFKQLTLNQLCCEFDWDYKLITNKEAQQYE